MSLESRDDLGEWSIVCTSSPSNSPAGIINTSEYQELVENLKSLGLADDEENIYGTLEQKIRESFGNLPFETNGKLALRTSCLRALSKHQISRWRDQRTNDLDVSKEIISVLTPAFKVIKDFYANVREKYSWTEDNFENRIHRIQRAALWDIDHRFERDSEGRITLYLDSRQVRGDKIRLRTEARSKTSNGISEKPIIVASDWDYLYLSNETRTRREIDEIATQKDIDDFAQKAKEETQWKTMLPPVDCEDHEVWSTMYNTELGKAPEIAEQLTRREALHDLLCTNEVKKWLAFNRWWNKEKRPRTDREHCMIQYEKEHEEFWTEMSKIDWEKVRPDLKKKVYEDLCTQLRTAIQQKKEKRLTGIGSMDDLWLDFNWDPSKFYKEEYESIDWPANSEQDGKQKEPLSLTTIDNGWFTYRINPRDSTFYDGIDEPKTRSFSDFIDINDPKYRRQAPSVDA